MFSRMTTSAIAFIAIAAPALADVTPAEVWQSWVDYYKANGYEITEGSREEAGTNLTLKDVTFAMTAADEGKVDLKVPQVTLNETGDGKVRTVFSDTLSGTATFKEDDGTVEIAFSGTMPGNETVSAGSLKDMTHESRMPKVTVTLDSIKGPKATFDKPVTLNLTNLVMAQRNVTDSALKVTSSGSADKVEINGDLKNTAPDAEGNEAVTFAATLEGLSGSGDATMPEGVDMTKDPNAALKAGFAASGQGAVQKMAINGGFTGKGEDGKDQTGNFKMSANGLSITGAFSQAGLSYQGDTDATSVEVTSSGLPIAITYGTQSSSFDIQMPVMKSDTPVPFKFAYSLGGLTLSDSIWDMFDAKKALPRDPADLDIDVTGMTRVLMDVFDPANMKTADAADAAKPEATTPETATPAPDATPDAANPDSTTADSTVPDEQPMPFEPTEVSINKLALSAAGARIDASGNLTTPEGGTIEAPVGKISSTLDGVNGLIDKLVQAGLLPQDQIAGMRMMLAMFAKPAPEGGDKLVSEIEFRDGGQIFANGLQVK